MQFKHLRIVSAGVLVAAACTAIVGLAQTQNELSGIYTIQQQSSGRHVDAFQRDPKDWAVVTRPRQDNASQKWIFSRTSTGDYTIQQQSNGRYMDAHATADKDFAIVTRAAQDNATQRWTVTPIGQDLYSIRQVSTRRYDDTWMRTRTRRMTGAWSREKDRPIPRSAGSSSGPSDDEKGDPALLGGIALAATHPPSSLARDWPVREARRRYWRS